MMNVRFSRKAVLVGWAAVLLVVTALCGLGPPSAPRIRLRWNQLLHTPDDPKTGTNLWSIVGERLVYVWKENVSVPWLPPDQDTARAMREVLGMFHDISVKGEEYDLPYEGPPSASGSEVLVVTAASTNHFEESKDMVASVQRCLPASRLLYYDLGLRPSEVRQVAAWCRVQYRAFNFSKFPKRVSVVHQKRFKPLIINEVMFRDILKSRPGPERVVFWVDASVRLLCGWARSNRTSPTSVELRTFRTRLSNVLRTAYREGLVMLSKASHVNHAVIHPNMYSYLPTDQSKMKILTQLESGLVFWTAQRHILFSILKWFTLCALLPECLHPDVPWYRCHFNRTSFAKCHRQDQSVLNILASNHFNFSQKRFFVKGRIDHGNGLVVTLRKKPRKDHVFFWGGPSTCNLT